VEKVEKVDFAPLFLKVDLIVILVLVSIVSWWRRRNIAITRRRNNNNRLSDGNSFSCGSSGSSRISHSAVKEPN
jgi:hypothetical protein